MRGMFQRAFLIAIFVLGSALGSLAESVSAEVKIRGVRFGLRTDATRVVIDLSENAKPSFLYLPDPYRLVIDFKGGRYAASKDGRAIGLVDGFRHGRFSGDVYRIVLDLEKPVELKRSFALGPKSGAGHRYVIDLVPTSRADFIIAARKSRPKRQVVKAPTVESAERGTKKLIVIDPGHGGFDPGAAGVNGIYEETVVLNIAREMRKVLEKTGRYMVHLTRDGDIYLPHRQRFQIAKKMQADLFISVHADSIDNPKVRGGTIYTLAERASDKEAERLAQRENKSDVLAGIDLAHHDREVSNILIELAQRDTMNESAIFAESLLPEMRRKVKMHKRGHRFASLLVLKSPDVPSVLMETGYLTNREDARLLNSSQGRKNLAQGLLAGLDRYFIANQNRAR